MKSNYHTHCHFCDGKGDPELYVEEALKVGLTTLGFSSHAPIKEENSWTLTDDQVEPYISRINELKEKYRDQLDIYLGLEVDYYPDENRFNRFRSYGLEYIIGSVHMVKPEGFDTYYSVDASVRDFQKVLDEVYQGDIRSFGKDYYRSLREMIEQGGFEILGHLDLFRKFNSGDRFFSEREEWYIDEVTKVLELLEKRDIIVEVNTGAISRGVQSRPYPSKWILEECNRRNIRVCLNSDVHSPEHIKCYYSEAVTLIKECGFNTLHTPFNKEII